MNSEEAKWQEVKQRLKIGDQVEGRVTDKAGFGDFIDIGEGFPALLESILMQTPEEYRYRPTDYYPLGSTVKAIIVLFDDWNRQIRLTQKLEKDIMNNKT